MSPSDEIDNRMSPEGPPLELSPDPSQPSLADEHKYSDDKTEPFYQMSPDDPAPQEVASLLSPQEIISP